jgi:hypothetical protein
VTFASAHAKMRPYHPERPNLPPAALRALGVFSNSCIGKRSGLDEGFVHIAPLPVLARLERLDDRVPSVKEVLRSVLILRRIAAADMAADEANAQVDPLLAHLETLLAAVAAGCDIAYLVNMRAGSSHQ